MPTQTIQQFGGLDLRDDVQEQPGAVDLLNVDLDAPGRVRTRNGYTQLSAGSSDVGVTSIVNSSDDGDFVTVALTSRARAYDSTGALLASSAALTKDALRLVNLGTPSASYVFAGAGDANGHLARWDGSVWAYPNVGYNGALVAATSWDNRLILARETFPTTDSSRVRFSDPGDPATFGANNFIDLTPGDNETINGIATWRDKVFVFKNSKFFVFYGTSADSTGQPVFNYRPVVGHGVASGATGSAVAAMEDGVYFANSDGVFRTTGGPGEKVSGPLDPLFGIGASSSYYTGGALTTAFYVNRFRRKLIVSIASSSYTLVYDTEHGTWTLWNIGAAGALEYYSAVTATPALVFADSLGVIYKMGSAYTTDNGTAIASKYRTGFLDFGAPEQEKWLRSMMLSGTGTVNVKTAVNDAVTLSSATSVAMGVSPAVGTGRWGAGTRGRNISVDISAASGAWSLSHLSMDIAATRAPGVRAA